MSDVPQGGFNLVSPAKSATGNSPPWWVLPSLGTLVFGIFGVSLGFAFLWGNETQQTTMLTAAVTLSSGVLGYFFGSSSGSQRKDDTIFRMKNGAPEAPPVAIAISNPSDGPGR